MTKQMEMNYGELCNFFKEEKRRNGKARQLQFKKWRKKYDIEKIEGRNRYIVKRKTYIKTKVYDRERKRIQFMDLLAPVIYTTLMNAEGNIVALTPLEQQRAFALINSRFELESIYYKTIAEEIGVNVKDLYSFKETIWKINNQTINNIINGMIKKGIILRSKGFKYRDEELYSADIYYLDKESIKFIYEKDIKPKLKKMLLSEEDIQNNLIEINTNNCIKISKSRNKNLLNISKYSKEKMINALIAGTEEECKKNYDAIISNMNDLEIYEENPNKIKSKKVIDTESSILYNTIIIKKGEINNGL